MTRRVITGVTVHGMDTARAPGPAYSHALSDGADPVFIKDRGAWRQMMRDKGLKPLEDGEAEAARRTRDRAIDEHRKVAVAESMDQAMSVFGQAGIAGVRNELQRQAPPEVKPPWTEPPSA